MSFDYIAALPLPTELIPARLRALFSPVGQSPQQRVEVACLFESPDRKIDDEYLSLQMAVVQGDSEALLDVIREAGQGVVAYSVPFDRKGTAADFSPSLSGHDYIVASWGSGSFYTYQLAEKVWMTLGLTPRCVGNDHQKLMYDDLRLPEFNVAQGEISSEYYWKSNRNISWTMSNEYLRKYLWLRGARGFRVFFYKRRVPDHPALRELMGNEQYLELKPESGPSWYTIDIREYKKELLLQVWACVEAVSSEPCPERSADGVIWPGDAAPMTHDKATALRSANSVFLDDKFLERYEQSTFYDTTPLFIDGEWHCSPSYKGQWGFTECIRVGRNLIQVPMRELYKPKPDREILHALQHARGPDEVARVDLDAEHIVAKTQRFLDQVLGLGDNLSALGVNAGLQKQAGDLIGFSRVELQANGWEAYPNLCKLAQVSPLDMPQHAFLSRCKQLHEILQKIPNGYLKDLLEKAGCPRAKLNSLGSIKLLQALLNIVQRLNRDHESLDAFSSSSEPEEWSEGNPSMAPLFLNNDLRIADAHEAVGKCINALQAMEFDTAHLNDGYGLALDFVMDGVIRALGVLNREIDFLRNREPA